jgi:hypothetical protein
MIQHMLARSSLRRIQVQPLAIRLLIPFSLHNIAKPTLTPFHRRHNDRHTTSRRERNDRHRYDSEDDSRERRSD